MNHKVLIIEDSTTSANLLKHLVKRANLTPVSASSLTEAAHIFSTSTPESYLCAIVDYNLPDAPNGEAIDFTIESFLPTVVITGSLDDHTRDRVLAKEVVDYIPKENAQVYDYLSRLLARLEKNKTIGVLVVDDSRVSRNAVSSLLRRHNFVTYQAATGEEGLETLNANPDIKLVITDENMPGISGIEMVAEIRRNYSKEDLVIIGVSSEGSSALSARFIKSGANDYLNKPYCHEEFFCRILQNVEYIENVEAIRRAANSDYLTGLPNRRSFFNRLKQALETPPQQMVAAVLDLDHFKSINDTYGHDAGDTVLKAVARLLAAHFSKELVARFGGEEFSVVFLDTPLEVANAALNKFRQAVAEKSFQFENESLKVTVSIGATDNFEGRVQDMLALADQHLYQAKSEGRNRVVCG